MILLGWCADYADSSSMVHGRCTSHQGGKGWLRPLQDGTRCRSL
jgi:hypothetical protein